MVISELCGGIGVISKGDLINNRHCAVYNRCLQMGSTVDGADQDKD